jgi:integrase/recombinase XerD
MGHASISGTAYYLRLTAESYPQIAARVRREHGGIVPPATAGTGHGD